MEWAFLSLLARRDLHSSSHANILQFLRVSRVVREDLARGHTITLGAILAVLLTLDHLGSRTPEIPKKFDTLVQVHVAIFERNPEVSALVLSKLNMPDSALVCRVVVTPTCAFLFPLIPMKQSRLLRAFPHVRLCLVSFRDEYGQRLNLDPRARTPCSSASARAWSAATPPWPRCSPSSVPRSPTSRPTTAS